MKLNALEFTEPALPEHAPQSYAAKCGLLTLLDPCPTAYTTGAKSFTSPMLLSTPSTRCAISSTVNPICRSFSRSFRSLFSMVRLESLSMCLNDDAVAGPIEGLKMFMNNLRADQNPRVCEISQPL